MSDKGIIVTGAREHNLKNISVTIPRNKLTIITGLSGSGKSSLAFDTIYAEGQRKYVESLSAYARQFLDQMQKPDVDHIEGLSPAISIEQRSAGSNPRSIVATTTEIHDYLRLMYASIGKAHCWKCGIPVSSQSAEEIVEQIVGYETRTRFMLLAPMVVGKKGNHQEVFQQIRTLGFVRVRVDGAVFELDELPDLDKRKKHTVEAVVDRLVLNADIGSRLTDSVELALRVGEGVLLLLTQQSGDKDWTERLFSELHACSDCGLSFDELKPRNFSFNSPYGACPTCDGLGAMEVADEELVVPDRSLSLADGAIQAWKRSSRRMIIWYNRQLKAVCEAYDIDMDRPYEKLPAKHRALLMFGSEDEEMVFKYWRGGKQFKVEKPFEGVIPNLMRRYQETDSDYTRQRLRKYMSRKPCRGCRGARLNRESLSCLVGGCSIQKVIESSIQDAMHYFDTIELSDQEWNIAREVIKEVRARLHFMHNVGLDYLSLDRESGSLSGGEAQRIRLATQIGSGLVGVVYVLDEPSIGLHQRDNQKLIHTLQGLQDIGNTVIVVEHDEETIRAADHVIDLGPAAGIHGGEIVFSGSVPKLLKSKKSLTAQYLNGTKSIPVPARRKAADGWIKVVGAQANNLKKISVKFPLGVMTCITGVSGSGKSTLVSNILCRSLQQHFYDSREQPGKHLRIEGLEQLDKVIVIDQSPIGRTPRSNPATYTGAFGQIRDLFAKLPASKVRGYGPGRYSFNVKGGRCEKCTGDGMLKIEMHFLPDVYVPCDGCNGLRYNRETLEVRYKHKNIAEVLDMTVEEALQFFDAVPALQRKFRTLAEVGLGYLKLGQSATTLSGGEAQRVKLSSELSKKATGRTLYILDEPTTGLHFEDVRKLVEVLLKLRESGNTLLVIEHNLDVIKTADHIIDMGPDGGDRGGKVVVQGSPEKVAKHQQSYTGKFLAEILKSS